MSQFFDCQRPDGAIQVGGRQRYLDYKIQVMSICPMLQFKAVMTWRCRALVHFLHRTGQKLICCGTRGGARTGKYGLPYMALDDSHVQPSRARDLHRTVQRGAKIGTSPFTKRGWGGDATRAADLHGEEKGGRTDMRLTRLVTPSGDRRIHQIIFGLGDWVGWKPR